MMTSPRILYTDIETAPHLVYRFEDLSYPTTTPLEFLVEPGRILSFAAKFNDEKTLFRGENEMDHSDMILSAWEMLNEADYVVTFNGNRFDIPWFNTEFYQMDLPKPSPYKSIDLYQVSKQFKLPSHKLSYISKRFGWTGKGAYAGKASSGGIETWVKILGGDKKVWKDFKKYNIQDVDVLVDGYRSLKSWLPQWHNVGVFMDASVCKSCGSEDLIRQGFTILTTGKYQRYVCGVCGTWQRSSKKVPGTGSDIR